MTAIAGLQLLIAYVLYGKGIENTVVTAMNIEGTAWAVQVPEFVAADGTIGNAVQCKVCGRDGGAFDLGDGCETGPGLGLCCAATVIAFICAAISAFGIRQETIGL